MDLTSLTMLTQKDIERQFAAIAHLYPLYTIQQCSWLKPASLIDTNIKTFWAKVLQYVDPNMTDDAASSAAMTAALESNIVGELMQWGRSIPHNAMPQAYANEIARRQYLVRVSASMGDIFKAVQTQDDLRVRSLIADLHEYHSGGVIELPQAGDVSERFKDVIRKGNRSIYTFIPPIDAATGGLERQNLTLLAARPSMGKTALALQIARNIAVSGSRVLFFSLEMSAVSLWARIVCPSEWRDFLAGKLTDIRRHDIALLSDEISGQLSSLHILDGRHTTETIWRTVAGSQPDVVIIDHLRYIKDKGENENKRQGMISETLHDLAKAFDIPVFCLVQLNRGVEKQAEKRPQLSDLRDSGEIEENADNVWMMYRESYYSNSGFTPTRDETELWVRKFRNGPPNIKISLQFNAKQEWFEPMK